MLVDSLQIEMMDSGKLDVTSIISEVAQQVVMHQAPGIQRCILADDKGKKLLQTEGVNLKVGLFTIVHPCWCTGGCC